MSTSFFAKMVAITLDTPRTWNGELNGIERVQGAKYTRVHQFEKMVYVEEFDSRSEAMKREREIKRSTTAKNDD